MEYKETHGDHTNTPCPHCGKTNHYVSSGVVVEYGKITLFQKPCFYCGKTIFYRAQYEIRITAYSYDPLDNSSDNPPATKTG